MKRKARKNKTLEESLKEKQTAKKGMKVLREHGRLNKFTFRETIPKVRKSDALFEWKSFHTKSEKHSDLLRHKQI